MEVIQYDDTYKKEWDEFVQTSLNGTLLHTRSFYQHNTLNQQDDSSLMFFKDKILIAILPCNVYTKGETTIMHSHLRATYGGLVIGKKTGVLDCFHAIKRLRAFAEEKKIQKIIIRPSFSIYHQLPTQQIDYALWLNGFSVDYREIELAIPLNSMYTENFSSSNKKNIKRALKSKLVINDQGNLEKFWELLETNLKHKYDTKPTHSIHEIKKLITSVGNDNVKLFTAECDGVTISGVLTILANRRVIHAQYIAMDEAFQKLGSLNLIIRYICRWSFKNNFSYFNLGMCCEPFGGKINEGLTQFKEGFGTVGVLRETLSIDLRK